MYKDEIKRTVNTEIYKHELKQVNELQQINEVYKGMIKEGLKEDFIQLDRSLRESLGLYQDFYTKDSYLEQLHKELESLQAKYNVLLDQYNQQKEKTLIQRIFNI